MRPLFQTSIPKSGTHLLRHILDMEWYDDHRIGKIKLSDGRWVRYKLSLDKRHIVGHIQYFREAERLLRGRVGVFLLRDPRDIIVSWHHWLDNCASHHIFSTLMAGHNIKDAEDRIAALIESLKFVVEGFVPWMSHPDILPIRYEELMEDPEQALAGVAESLGLPLGNMVEKAKFRGGTTYRKGTPGDWETEFEKHHRDAFDEGWANIMDAFGYA